MKKAVHFGAGKIGRGFIAELLHDSGYEIVFGDVVDALVDIVNKEHQYPLFLIDHDYEEKIIDHVVAYSNIKDPDKIIDAICEAEVITTSVMATNLPKIAPLLTKGLAKRLEQGKGKTTVMACENAIMGTDILKKAFSLLSRSTRSPYIPTQQSTAWYSAAFTTAKKALRLATRSSSPSREANLSIPTPSPSRALSTWTT